MTALHICLRMLFCARRANKLLGVGFLSCSDCHSFGHLGTFAPWEQQSVKQNQTRNYGMFSFDRGVCVCEQAGIWLPTNPNFAATCSSPVCVVLLAYIGKLREHQNGVNTFSTFIIFPVVLSHPPSSTVTACLGPAFPRKFTFGGRGSSLDRENYLNKELAYRRIALESSRARWLSRIAQWWPGGGEQQVSTKLKPPTTWSDPHYYLVRPPTAVSALLIPLTLPELLSNVALAQSHVSESCT